MHPVVKFLPSYVGSKARWVAPMWYLHGQDFVEVFCGSASLSASLAHRAHLNDVDPFIYKILKHYDQQIVPEVFTEEDYFRVRGLENWWQYAYCLLSMSFSGVFRYGPRGFNVPIKKHLKAIRVKSDYRFSLERWRWLKPTVTNLPFEEIDLKVCRNKVVILDPPYEDSKTAYNGKFDYNLYWEFVSRVERVAKCVVLFDYQKNNPFPNLQARKMVVNGKYEGSMETAAIFDVDLDRGTQGEQAFEKCMQGTVRRHPSGGRVSDFEVSANNPFQGACIEVKTDYYGLDTGFMMLERYSSIHRKTPGGVWQAEASGSRFFVYFYYPDNVFYWFNTRRLRERLEEFETDPKYRSRGNFVSMALHRIVNEGYDTGTYRIPRSSVEDLACVVEAKDAPRVFAMMAKVNAVAHK